MILIGLVLLVAAAVVGAVGVATNLGSTDALASSFNVFGVQITGSAGWLFLYGIVVGGIGMLGVGILYDDFFRRYEKWRELRETRRETEDLREENELLAEQLDVERAESVRAGAPADAVEGRGAQQPSAHRRARPLRFLGRGRNSRH